MNIPYSEQEKISMNHTKYPDFFSKAQKIFSIFNGREDFCRGALKKYSFIRIKHIVVHIIISGRHDLFVDGIISQRFHPCLEKQVEFFQRLPVLLHFRRDPP